MANDQVTIKDLLYGLMMASGNDAAIALSEAIGGTTDVFVSMMNKKAMELNLKNTHFVTPHGLDNDAHYTTAYELALLADYALQNETFAKIVKTANYTVNLNGRTKNLNNTNELLGYLSGVYGVKTGFTNGANRCLVTACKRGDLDVICVVLGCDTKKNRTVDSINLINYVFNNFSKVNIKSKVDQAFEEWKLKNINSFNINKGVNSQVEVYLNEEQIPYNTVAVHNLKKEQISITIFANFEFEAPLMQETVIGTMNVKLGEDELFTVQILNKNAVEKKDVFYYFKSFLVNYCSYF